MFKRFMRAIFIKWGTCPNCLAPVSYGMTTGETHCPKCKKRVIIRNGEIVGVK